MSLPFTFSERKKENDLTIERMNRYNGLVWDDFFLINLTLK